MVRRNIRLTCLFNEDRQLCFSHEDEAGDRLLLQRNSQEDEELDDRHPLLSFCVVKASPPLRLLSPPQPTSFADETSSLRVHARLTLTSGRLTGLAAASEVWNREASLRSLSPPIEDVAIASGPC